MSDPPRLLGTKSLSGELLASAKSDRAPSGARRRAVVAAAAAVVASTKAATATATLGTIARLAVWKWVALGTFAATTVVAAHAIVVAPLPAPTVAVARPKASPLDPPVSHAIAPATASALPPPPALPPARPSAAQETRAPLTPALPAQPAAQPSPETSRLSLEITSLDRTKRTLASGDAEEALRQLDAYRASFPRGLLAPEASALHIEALARAGRREEARSELRALRASDPDSPVLEKLGRVVGE